MKQLFVILFLSISLYSVGQKVVVDKDGNYRPVSKSQDKPTNKVYIDKDSSKYVIYLNSKNKMYIIRKSKKTGKEYKSYLKTT